MVRGGGGFQGLIEFVNSTTCVSLRPPGGQTVKGREPGSNGRPGGHEPYLGLTLSDTH